MSITSMSPAELRQATLSSALRQAYSRIVHHFRQEPAGRRMRSWVIPKKTEFLLNPNS
jgi:hypothetical protein